MKVTATTAQRRYIVAAAEAGHGVIVFRNLSAWQQIQMARRMTAAGLVHPGTAQITFAAVRAYAPKALEAAHTAALALNH